MIPFYQRWRQHAEGLAVLAVTTILTVLALGWLGFDIRYLSSAIIGDHANLNFTSNEAAYNYYMLYQAIDNLLERPLDPGYSLLFYNDANSYAVASGHYGIALFMLPAYFLSGQNLILTYNLYLILTFPLTAWGVFLLLRYLLKAPPPVAALMGIMVAFNHYRMSYIRNLENISTQFYWFGLYAFHRLLDTPRTLWAVALGVSTGLLVISSGYLGIFLLVTLAIIGLYALIRRRITLAHVPYLAMAGLVAAGLSLPFVLFRFQNEVFSEGHGYWLIRVLSARPAHWLSGASFIFGGYWPEPNDWITHLLVGITPLVLSIVAIIQYWRSTVSTEVIPGRAFTTWQVVELYVIITVSGYLLSLGPRLKWGEQELIALPYNLLWFLPGFQVLRVVSRFVVLAITGTTVLCAATLTHRLANIQSRWLVLAVAGLLAIEFFPADRPRTGPVETEKYLVAHVRDFDAPVYRWLAQQPPGTPLIHYPLDYTHDSDILPYLPTYEQPVLNGMGALFPRWYPEYQIGEYHLVLMYQRHIQYMVVHTQDMNTRQKLAFDRGFRQLQAEWHAFDQVGQFGGIDVYRIDIHPPEAAFYDFNEALPVPLGWNRPVVTADGVTYMATIAESASLSLLISADHDLQIIIRAVDRKLPGIYETLKLTANGEPVALTMTRDNADARTLSGLIAKETLQLSPGILELVFHTDERFYLSESEEPDGVALDWVKLTPIEGRPNQ